MLSRLRSQIGPILGPSWGHLGPSWAILGHLGAILGPSWAILGPSWGHLGPSWGHLGGLLEELCVDAACLAGHLEAKSHFGPILEPFWGPFWSIFRPFLDTRPLVFATLVACLLPVALAAFLFCCPLLLLPFLPGDDGSAGARVSAYNY